MLLAERQLLFLVLSFFVTANVSNCFAQSSSTLNISDIGGATANSFDVTGTAQLSESPDIFSDLPEFGSALTEYDLQGINADGIFAAQLRGTVNRKNNVSTGDRTLGVGLYEADGVIDASDLYSTPIQNATRDYPQFSYDSSTENSVLVEMDVTQELIASVRRSTSHIGMSVRAISGTGTSTINPESPIELELTEYYANPLDAAPEFQAETGLSFRGQAGEPITRGTTRTLLDDEYTFSVERNFDNGISVDIQKDTESWIVDMSAPGRVPLVSGDSFNATRWPFQETDSAGFDFGDDGRGLNSLTAFFEINELVYDIDGEVLSLDVSFMQRARGFFEERTSVGRLKFNVTAVPEPSGFLWLAIFSVVAATTRNRKVDLRTRKLHS